MDGWGVGAVGTDDGCLDGSNDGREVGCIDGWEIQYQYVIEAKTC